MMRHDYVSLQYLNHAYWCNVSLIDANHESTFNHDNATTKS